MQLGDQVTWTSQAHASSKTKLGTIVYVLPAGAGVRTALLDFSQYNTEAIKKAGGPRRGESYLVAVPSKTGRGRVRLYWPVASKLQVTSVQAIVASVQSL